MELVDLGEGYVLYFKLMIYFGIIGIFFYGINIYKVVANIQGSNCKDDPNSIDGSDLQFYSKNNMPPCHKDWVNPHSIAGYGLNKIDLIERALMVAFLSAFWVSMAYIYHLVIEICREIDERNDTPCDWTLMVGEADKIKNLPKEHNEQNIKESLQQDAAFASGGINIKKISIAYDLVEFLKLSQKVTAKRNQVKKMQFKESRMKSFAALPEMQDLKANQPSTDPARQEVAPLSGSLL